MGRDGLTIECNEARIPGRRSLPGVSCRAALVRQAVVSLGGSVLVDLDVTVRELLASRVKDWKRNTVLGQPS